MNATDFTLHQGKTFQRIVRWEAPPFIYKAITAINNGAPMEITVPAHGVPEGWRVALTSVKGMDELNAAAIPPKNAEFRKASVVNANTIQLNSVVSADFKPYISGGYVVYYTPVPLAGYTARLTIKNRVGGTVLKALTSPTDIVIDDIAKTIALSISAADTAAFAKGTYVYDLEMVSAGGVVTLLLSGKLTVVPEVTT